MFLKLKKLPNLSLIDNDIFLIGSCLGRKLTVLSLLLSYESLLSLTDYFEVSLKLESHPLLISLD